MNKVAVVTGSSKGIGAATAVAFGKAGYDVVVNCRSSSTEAEDVAKQIEGFGQKALIVQADVFTQEGVSKLFSEVKNVFFTIDVLVNNAGNPKEPQFGEYTHKNVTESVMGNFASAVMCSQEAVKLMEEGSILFTSSIYGLQFGGNPTLPLYSAGKAAMINFTQTLAEILAPTIRCNVVAPGVTKTPAWDNANPDYVEKSLKMTLQKQWVEPEEIADAFVFLAETPHINAQTITIDAGWQKKIREASKPKH
jgi:3-oxoacyl-[acyl-carrier protein] reductase